MLLALKLTLILSLLPLLQAIPQPFASGDPVYDLLTYGTAIGTTFALGAVKKYTNAADTWLGSKLKPVQPILVGVLSVALPLLIHGTPNVPDAGALVVAPTATLLSVAAAEVLRRVAGPARQQL